MAVIAAAYGFALDFFKALLGAEAAVRLAIFYKLLGVGQVHVLALGLDIRAEPAANVGAFVVLKSSELERIIDKVDRALNKALAVGVLNPQNKFAALRFRHKVLIKSRAKISHMHKARGAGRVTGANRFFTHKIPSKNKYAIQNKV